MQRDDVIERVLETAFGSVSLAVTPAGLFRLTLPAEKTQTTTVVSVRRKKEDRKCLRFLKEIEVLLKAYFACKPVDFRAVPLDLEGYTLFEKKILTALALTARGELLSYGELGLRAGFPGSARAVGQVMNKNRIPIIIPCHRVIKSDGGLGGFACGLGWKRRLLKIEGISCSEAKTESPNELLLPLLNV